MRFRAQKNLGQNFLVNARVAEKIISAAELRGDETVLEVGPGRGALTEGLLVNAREVIAIEKDKRLFDFLEEKFAGAQNLRLINADALTVDPPPEPYLLIANIPYNITSPLLDHYIRDNYEHSPERAVVMVQKEVAEKICARPPRMNVLALHVQTFGVPKKIAVVSRGSFNPRPKVDSAILRIDFDLPRSKNIEPGYYQRYFGLIHQAFAHKRKMLRSVFSPELLKRAKINSTSRAETLGLEDWRQLLIFA